MDFDGPYRYSLFLSGPKKKRVLSRKEQDGVPTKFGRPVTQRLHPKIYVLKATKKNGENEIVYVGYASQSIGARLDGGFRAKGEKGYHGYKWQWEKELELLVFMFDEFTGNEKADRKYKEFVEAIEAELVYLVRETTGDWPRCQNEIHFNNKRREEVKKVAGEVYEMVKS